MLNRIFKITIDAHRKGLIDLYNKQLEDANQYMVIVLQEAIRKLRETDIHPYDIENWVIRLENDWVRVKDKDISGVIFFVGVIVGFLMFGLFLKLFPLP